MHYCAIAQALQCVTLRKMHWSGEKYLLLAAAYQDPSTSRQPPAKSLHQTANLAYALCP